MGFSNTVIQQILTACPLYTWGWEWAESEPRNWDLVLSELTISSWKGTYLKVESVKV